MAAAKGLILVTGATGKQGGAVTRHLLAAGYQVRALTRDPQAEKAARLREIGVDLVQADLTDGASLGEALDRVDGVFSMATPFEKGLDAEVAQGVNLGDAAAAAGVKHYVYSSVGGAERDSKVPHFESKWRIEEHLRALGLPLTVIRPVWFFENLPAYTLQPAGEGFIMPMPLAPDRPFQGVAADDIGAVVARALAEPERWIGREVELAGDERTLSLYAEAASRDLGLPVTYVQVPWEAIRERSEDLAKMYEFFEREGYQADLPALRAELPGLRTFDQWLAEGGLRLLGKAA